MVELNRAYMGREGTTDVLSFPLYESPREFPDDREFLLGDIVIDPLRAAEQARYYGITLRQELRRLLVHGLLHLAGYDHERNPYQKRRMREKEEAILKAL